MPTSRRGSRYVLVLTATLAASSSAAAAQGWSTLPNGQVGYTATYTSTGSFFCYGAGFAPGSSCNAFGNSLTLGSNGSFLTLTFNGTTQDIVATNVRAPVTSLGTITKSYNGTGPFQFPTPLNSNVISFGFKLTIDETGPARGYGVKQFGYIIPQTASTVASVNCCGDDVRFVDYTSLPTTAAGYPFRYGLVVFDHFSDLALQADNTAVNVGAQVGVIPEPTTLALAGAGLVGLGFAAARRRTAR